MSARGLGAPSDELVRLLRDRTAEERAVPAPRRILTVNGDDYRRLGKKAPVQREVYVSAEET